MSAENTMQIIRIDHYEYEPDFCVNTGKFIDSCPWLKRKTDQRVFKCNCTPTGTIFVTGELGLNM